MDNNTLIDILNKIRACVEYDLLDTAKDLLKLEIENLKGTTPKRCFDTFSQTNNWHCKNCCNMNCNYNKKIYKEVTRNGKGYKNS